MLALASCRFGAPAGSSTNGRDISNLYRLFVYVALGVGVVVYGLILWAAVAYRRRKDDAGELPAQTRYHLKWEVTYTVVPFLIVIVLFIWTFRTEARVDRVNGNPAVTVEVTGFQWQWRFRYPSAGVTIVGTATEPPVMVVPAGRTIEIDLASQDVIHSFYVPDFLFKRDAIPGFPNRFDLTIPRTGLFRGECAEFCGLDHSGMTFYVRAVPPAQFQAWLGQQQAMQTGAESAG